MKPPPAPLPRWLQRALNCCTAVGIGLAAAAILLYGPGGALQ